MTHLRIAIRQLLGRPLFAGVAILTLALGIGANSAIFSAVNALLLRPLPFREVDRLVAIWERTPRALNDHNELSPANFDDYQREAKSFERVAALAWWTANLTGGDRPERVQGFQVTPGFFDVLGVRAELGRSFLADDARPGGPRVVVLSHGLWVRRYGADRAIVGRSLSINGRPYTVAGVMPAGVLFPAASDLWGPLVLDSATLARRQSRYLNVIGRLKPGVTAAAAQAELTGIAATLAARYPASNAGWGATVAPLVRDLTRRYSLVGVLLLGAAGFVLLIACANVANLMLVRAAARRREMAVRAALGAGRGQLVRQLLAESAVLAACGGAAGLLVAAWGIDLLRATVPASVRRFIAGYDQIALDGRVLGFTLAIAVLTGLLFGLAPALSASRADLRSSLGDGGRTGESRRRARVRSSLVVGEVALSLLLLVGAGLLLRSASALRAVNPGFDANGLLTLRMSLPRATYTNPQQVIAFYDQALQRVRAIPGVRDAALTSDFPLGGSNSSTSFAIAGRPAPAPGEGPDVRYRDVVPGYFAAMRIPIRRGREFTGADGATSQHVAMINEAAAKRYFPGTDPLGQQLTFPPDTVTRWTIVGVAANVREWQLRDQPDPGLYFPESQDVSWSMVLAVRASGPIPPGSLLAPVRTSIGALDPDLPLFDVLTTDDLVSGQMALEGVALRLLGLFAVLALTLAAVGLGGVMAYSVEQRTHDIGVRMALGARAGDVVRLVLRQGMVLTAIGVGLGAAGALALSGALRRLLYGVSPFDVTTLMAVALLLGAVALVATWIPARRAAGVDPVIALRSE